MSWSVLYSAVPGFGNVAFAASAWLFAPAIRKLNSDFVIWSLPTTATESDEHVLRPAAATGGDDHDGEQQCNRQEAEKSHENPSE